MARLVSSARSKGQFAVFQQDDTAADSLRDRLPRFWNFHFENDFRAFFQVCQQRF